MLLRGWASLPSRGPLMVRGVQCWVATGLPFAFGMEGVAGFRTSALHLDVLK